MEAPLPKKGDCIQRQTSGRLHGLPIQHHRDPLWRSGTLFKRRSHPAEHPSTTTLAHVHRWAAPTIARTTRERVQQESGSFFFFFFSLFFNEGAAREYRPRTKRQCQKKGYPPFSKKKMTEFSNLIYRSRLFDLYNNKCMDA